MKEITMYGEKIIIMQEKYLSNGNTALEGFLKETGEPFLTFTVNLDYTLPENQAFIKNYSENQGVLGELKLAGVISKILTWEKTGFVHVPLCELDLTDIPKCRHA